MWTSPGEAWISSSPSIKGNDTNDTGWVYTLGQAVSRLFPCILIYSILIPSLRQILLSFISYMSENWDRGWVTWTESPASKNKGGLDSSGLQLCLLASTWVLATQPVPLSKSESRLASSRPQIPIFPVLYSPLYLMNSEVKQVQNKRYIQAYLKEKIFIYITIFFLQCFHFLNSKILQEIGYF